MKDEDENSNQIGVRRGNNRGEDPSKKLGGIGFIPIPSDKRGWGNRKGLESQRL